MREGIAHILKSSGKFTISAAGSGGSDALRIAEVHRPSLLVLDLDIRGGGITVARQITERWPQVRIVILTVSESQEHVCDAMAAGARGYILKSVSAGELVGTLLSIHAGLSYVTPQLAARLLARPPRAVQAPSKLDELTHRETEILGNVAKGMTNKEIANVLNLSEKTVKHYMTNVMQKLQVRNRMEAVLTLRSVTAR